MTANVDVVLRTKERPFLLDRALRSISAQTHPSVSTIIVNDGGDPGVLRQVVSSAWSGGALEIHDNVRSVGRPVAANQGIEATSADYVVLHDDDDSWEPRFLEAAVGALEQDPELGGAATKVTLISERVEVGSIIEERRSVFAEELTDITLFDTLRRNTVPPISLVMRRSALDQVGHFVADLPVLEDWDLLLRLLVRYPVALIAGPPLANWHHRPSGVGSEANSVYADSSEHDRFDAVVRDRHFRADMRGEGVGLGSALMSAGWARDVQATVRATGTELTNHVEMVSTRDYIEIGRVRGEMLSATEQLERIERAQTITDRRLDKLTQAQKDLPGAVRRVDERVNDIWLTDKKVQRERRSRQRNEG